MPQNTTKALENDLILTPEVPLEFSLAPYFRKARGLSNVTSAPVVAFLSLSPFGFNRFPFELQRVPALSFLST